MQEVIDDRPQIVDISVVFPAPFGPRIETISPLFTLNEQSSIMLTPPYPPVNLEAEKYIIF